MSKPLTYLDREVFEKKKYLFVSYSHKDEEIVYKILNCLYDSGLNYWYDAEINVGENWEKKVKKYLIGNNCVGALLFVSNNSFNSEQVFIEVCEINKLKERKNFITIVVHVNTDELDNPIIDLISNAKGAEILKKGAVFIANYNTLLDNKIISTSALFDIKNVCADIINGAIDVGVTEKAHVGKEDRHKLIESNFNTLIEGKDIFIKYGKYNIENANKEDDILWKLIRVKDEKYYFISKYCLDFVSINDDKFERKIEEKLENKKYLDYIGKIKESFLRETLSLKDGDKIIGECIPTDYADTQRQQQLRLFWIEQDNGNLTLYNCLNKKIDAKNISTKINAGVRLMLIIDLNKGE